MHLGVYYLSFNEVDTIFTFSVIMLHVYIFCNGMWLMGYNLYLFLKSINMGVPIVAQQ